MRDSGLEQRSGQQEESCFAVHLSISVNRSAGELEWHYFFGVPASPARMPTAVRKRSFFAFPALVLQRALRASDRAGLLPAVPLARDWSVEQSAVSTTILNCLNAQPGRLCHTILAEA